MLPHHFICLKNIPQNQIFQNYAGSKLLAYWWINRSPTYCSGAVVVDLANKPHRVSTGLANIQAKLHDFAKDAVKILLLCGFSIAFVFMSHCIHALYRSIQQIHQAHF